MSYKVTKANESYVYTANGHYDCQTTRLHDPQDVNDGKLVCGLTHFLPGGGIEKKSNPAESIYYVLEGEMTVYIGDETYVLQKGDSIHFGGGVERECKNTSIATTQMLVCILPAGN